MNGRHGPSELAVHLFRERRVYIPCPKAGFDVADGDLLIIRSQGTGKGRRRITVNEDQIRLFFGQDVLEAQERLRRNIVQGLALGHDVQVVIRRNPEQLQDLVEHLTMLGRDGNDRLNAVGMFL